ncbi:MFS transporter [bacterium SCSIO 12741]|nr:MFS transporter [bacterium SCSIO 12741]
MSGSKFANHSPSTLLSLIVAGEAIFFLPFVLVRIFRPTFLEVFELNNLQLGTCFSIYGIVATVSYFFGGPLADRFPARNLMSFALWATGVGGLFLLTIPSQQQLMWLYGFWGMTTILLFWAALIRATREWGGSRFQGRAFGLLEGGRGLAAALIGAFGLALFSVLMDETGDGNVQAQHLSSFGMVILGISLMVLASGIWVWMAIPAKTIKQEAYTRINLRHLLPLFKQRSIWLQGIIIVCAYSGYKITDDLSLYAHDVLGFDQIQSAGVGTAALWMRPLFAVLAGFLADRYSASKVGMMCFASLVLGGLLIAGDFFRVWTMLSVVLLLASVAGVYALRGIYFALLEEAHIPLSSTGAAVGLMSVIGYTPDIFMSPLMGYLLDTYPGSLGHQLVFLVLSGFGLLGAFTLFFFRKSSQLIPR